MMQLNQQPVAHQLPPLPTGPNGDVDLYELITVTARLKDLLERETEHLKKMEVKEISKFQQEKHDLTVAMEAYQALIAARPELVQMMDEASREELVEISEQFSYAVAENMRRTAAARAVNQRLVSTIMEVVTETQHAGTYNKYGSSAVPSNMTVSFNLNQKA
jgi:hypothetical protein